MIVSTSEKVLTKIDGPTTGQAAISVVITSEKGTVFNEDTSIAETLCTCTV